MIYILNDRNQPAWEDYFYLGDRVMDNSICNCGYVFKEGEPLTSCLTQTQNHHKILTQ